MAVQPDMVGMVVRDMAAALRFYRLLGLAIPEGVEGEPYVEVITPNGYRISWNSLEMTKSIDPDWVEPVGQRVSLAFKCDSPAEVDALRRQALAGRHTRRTSDARFVARLGALQTAVRSGLRRLQFRQPHAVAYRLKPSP